MTRDERSDYFLTLLQVFRGGAAAFNAALIAFFNMCALIPPHLTPRNITRRHKKEMIPPASHACVFVLRQKATKNSLAHRAE
jgi:hypothetical protein